MLQWSFSVLTFYDLSFVFVCSVMDGMTEACVKGGIEACYTSVSCACALLSALDELLKGRGIQPEQVRTLLLCCMFTYCFEGVRPSFVMV